MGGWVVVVVAVVFVVVVVVVVAVVCGCCCCCGGDCDCCSLLLPACNVVVVEFTVGVLVVALLVHQIAATARANTPPSADDGPLPPTACGCCAEWLRPT